MSPANGPVCRTRGVAVTERQKLRCQALVLLDQELRLPTRRRGDPPRNFPRRAVPGCRTPLELPSNRGDSAVRLGAGGSFGGAGGVVPPLDIRDGRYAMSV